MANAAYEYELEALPEFGSQETEWEGESESEQFLGALANLAKRGASWLATSGSPQRNFALWAARQALNRGLPALGNLAGSSLGGASGATKGTDLGQSAASWLSGLLPQQELEAEWEGEGELNPVRKWYPDAMLEHLGHAAAVAEHEAEAEALAGAMIPLITRTVPRAAPVILRATPGLVCGTAGIVRSLHRSPTTRPLIRVVPAIVRSTANVIGQQVSRGVPVTPQTAVRTLARQAARVLGNRQMAVQAFRRSQQLDRQLHSRGPAAPCHRCGGAR